MGLLSLYNVFACCSILLGRNQRFSPIYTEMDRRDPNLHRSNSNYLVAHKMPISSHSDHALMSSVSFPQNGPVPCQMVPSSSENGPSMLRGPAANFCQIRQSQVSSKIMIPKKEGSYRSDENSQSEEPLTVGQLQRKSSKESMIGVVNTFQNAPKRNSTLRQNRSKSSERRKPEKSVSFRGPILSD